MSVEDKSRHRTPRRRLRRFAKGLMGALGPSERSILTREGLVYFVVSLALLVAGLIQQVNLILLVFTLAAGPFLASIFGGRSMLRRLTVIVVSRPTSSPAIRWCSTMPWRTAGGGMPHWPCSSTTR